MLCFLHRIFNTGKQKNNSEQIEFSTYKSNLYSLIICLIQTSSTYKGITPRTFQQKLLCLLLKIFTLLCVNFSFTFTVVNKINSYICCCSFLHSHSIKKKHYIQALPSIPFFPTHALLCDYNAFFSKKKFMLLCSGFFVCFCTAMRSTFAISKNGQHQKNILHMMRMRMQQQTKKKVTLHIFFLTKNMTILP